MSHCEICGAKMAGSKEGYATHIRKFHNMTVNKQSVYGTVAAPMMLEPTIKGDGSTGRKGSAICVPVKQTNRSKERIIQELEWTLGKAVFPDTRPVKF